MLQDLEHVCHASGVGAALDGASIPVAAGAELAHALGGGDDYELLFTAPDDSNLVLEVYRIGVVTQGSGIRIDGELTEPTGYQHFS